jgi:hypothetical protein
MGCVPCKTPSANNYKCSEGSLHEENIRLFNVERRSNLESYQLVWLGDASSLKIENLRGIIDYTTIFDNLEECQSFLEETRNITTFLVISYPKEARLVREHLSNIRSVYIYKPDGKNRSVDHSKTRVSFCSDILVSSIVFLYHSSKKHIQHWKNY